MHHLNHEKKAAQVIGVGMRDENGIDQFRIDFILQKGEAGSLPAIQKEIAIFCLEEKRRAESGGGGHTGG
jgi:hypothetical protein